MDAEEGKISNSGIRMLHRGCRNWTVILRMSKIWKELMKEVGICLLYSFSSHLLGGRKWEENGHLSIYLYSISLPLKRQTIYWHWLPMARQCQANGLNFGLDLLCLIIILYWRGESIDLELESLNSVPLTHCVPLCKSYLLSEHLVANVFNDSIGLEALKDTFLL